MFRRGRSGRGFASSAARHLAHAALFKPPGLQQPSRGCVFVYTPPCAHGKQTARRRAGSKGASALRGESTGLWWNCHRDTNNHGIRAGTSDRKGPAYSHANERTCSKRHYFPDCSNLYFKLTIPTMETPPWNSRTRTSSVPDKELRLGQKKERSRTVSTAYKPWEEKYA